MIDGPLRSDVEEVVEQQLRCLGRPPTMGPFFLRRVISVDAEFAGRIHQFHIGNLKIMSRNEGKRTSLPIVTRTIASPIVCWVERTPFDCTLLETQDYTTALRKLIPENIGIVS